uniref:Uncharacterized protein n=1 Tax=viral metagenome TaxID=1070528 RepID=A0A6M3LAF7_9ZZZZ
MNEEWKFSGYIPDLDDEDTAEIIMHDFLKQNNTALIERPKEFLFRAGFWRGMAWQKKKMEDMLNEVVLKSGGQGQSYSRKIEKEK